MANRTNKIERRSVVKSVIFKKQGGDFKVIKVIGDNKKETWGKILDRFIYDFEFNGVKADLIKDKFKIYVES